MATPRAPAGVLAALIDLVLPVSCVGCGAPGPALCASCLDDLGGSRRGPLRADVPGLPTVAAAAYDGVVRAALLRYKERGRRDLAPDLAALLSRAVDRVAGLVGRAGLAGKADGEVARESAAGATAGTAGARSGGTASRLALVPVPSQRRAAAARGGDHVARLALRVAADQGVRVAPALRLSRPVLDSAALSPAQRAANLRSAMTAKPAPSGWSALIVDDIVTTGATLLEAQRALRTAGWDVLGAATIAVTELRATSLAQRLPQPRASSAGPLATPRGPV